MEKRKIKELRPQRVIVHLTDEDHKILVQTAKEQNRTITGQACFWLLEKIRLKKDAIKKENFDSHAAKIYERK